MGVPLVTIDANGITVPAFADVLEWYKGQYRAIFGQDIYLENDSQDLQWIAIQASAINDVNARIVATYNSFSPSTAQGVGLSRVVKINGIARSVATYSTVDVIITGQAGTTISNGIVADANLNTRWYLPATVVIPYTGQITVTATAESEGDIAAAAGSISQIATPTYGWQSVTNPLASVEGAPVETDAALRRRQASSTAIPSRTVLEGALGAVAAISGVTRYVVYENDTDVPNDDGIPAHSLAFVVEGGDDTAIASAIFTKKGPGPGTVGTTSVTVTDTYGVQRVIRFYRPTDVPITYAVTLKPLAGYTSGIQAQVQQALSDWTNSLAIGADALLTRSYVPANLGGGAGSETFEILSLQVARDGANPAAADVPIAFNEAAACAPANVTITVSA